LVIIASTVRIFYPFTCFICGFSENFYICCKYFAL